MDSENILNGEEASDLPVAGKTGDLQKRRKQAKIGLGVSIGLLVATGFGGSKAAKRLHIASGVALVGFSIWHHRLYGTKGRKKS